MAIDVTRVKRTRGGHEVRIYATDGVGGEAIHGAIKSSVGWVSYSWNSDGHLFRGEDNPLDLIEEPRTVEEIDCWYNVYADTTGSGWKTKEEADRSARSDRIACINIKRTVTEGEGL